MEEDKIGCVTNGGRERRIAEEEIRYGKFNE